MDVIHDCLSLIPVPYLSVAFKIFQSIYSSVQRIKQNKAQLQALAQCVAVMLQCLNTQYETRQLSMDGTTTCFEQLVQLLEEISCFVERQATHNFFKHFIFKEQTIVTTNNYHRRIIAAVNSFQISALLDIRELQRLNSEAQAADQRLLHARLLELETNQNKFLKALNIQNESVMAIMSSLQRISSKYSKEDPESQFISKSLRCLTTWSGRQVIMEPWMITKYEVEIGPMIGRGGFGRVHKAIWNHSDVALKLFKTEASVIPDLRDIVGEIKTWSELRHPHIIQFFGANTLDNDPFVVMPLYKKGNALDYVRDNKSCNRLKILHEVAQGLAYLHSHKIVHGDVKGTNILISDADTALLCDFGLTKMKTEVASRSINEASTITGSPNWMAPERLMGRSLKPPADIYAFGMTIYEIYTNKIPLGDANLAHLVVLVVDRDVRPERPEYDAPQMSDDVWQLAESCWVKKPESRPIASALQIQYEEGKPQCQGTPEGFETIKGKQNPATVVPPMEERDALTSLHKSAMKLFNQGKYDASESLFRQVRTQQRGQGTLFPRKLC